MESVTSNDSMMSDMSTTSDLDVGKATPATPATTVTSKEPTNNNSLPHEISHEELELLKKLEEQNRCVFKLINLFILVSDP
jgi:hypothetical protein